MSKTTGVAGSGLLSEERRFISGPDSSTTSVLAGLLATLSAMEFAEFRTVNLALATLFLTSVVCAVSFYALGRFKLAGLVRFMPFSAPMKRRTAGGTHAICFFGG